MKALGISARAAVWSSFALGMLCAVAPVMAQQDAIGQAEGTVAASLVGKTRVAFQVAGIRLQRVVTDQQQTAGTQHAFEFRHDISLRLVVRHAGQHGEAQHGVDGSVGTGKPAAVVHLEAQARNGRARSRFDRTGRVLTLTSGGCASVHARTMKVGE